MLKLTTERMSADIPTRASSSSSISSTSENEDEANNTFKDENPNYRFPEFADTVKELKDTQRGARNVARGSVKWLDVTAHDVVSPPSSSSSSTPSSAAAAAAESEKLLNDFVKRLKEEGYVLLVSDVAKEARDITTIEWDKAPFSMPSSESTSAADSSSSSCRRSKICVVMGNELVGVSARLRAHADAFFTIPNRGFAESYNLSVSYRVGLVQETHTNTHATVKG